MAKIGIPRGLFFYYYGDLWQYFFDYLKIPYIVSPPSNKKINLLGIKNSNDEMCMALKLYIGHVAFLSSKCDYILIPRIDNFNIHNQTCTNFLAVYDIVCNLFDKPILNYNIDIENRQKLKAGLFKIGLKLGCDRIDIKKAYKYSLKKWIRKRKKELSINIEKLNSSKRKILIVSHPYNTYDEVLGMNVIKYLEKNNIELIYSDKFYGINNLSKQLTNDLYFKYAKDNVGAITYCLDKIDGIIFITSFPCALDCLVNELITRKITVPNINLVLDDNFTFTGLETRLESFVDMLEVKN